jgi:outer membrane protein
LLPLADGPARTQVILWERAAALERKNQQTDTADSAPVREALYSRFDMVSRRGRFEGFGECEVRGAVCAVSVRMRHFDFQWGRMNFSKQLERRKDEARKCEEPKHQGWRTGEDQVTRRLAGWAAIAATILSTLAPLAQAQQQINPGSATQGLPTEPVPNATLPLYMRPSGRDFRDTPSHFPNPIAPYRATSIDTPSIFNSPRLNDLLRNGKIYLSLSDAVMLALENNFDIAIARYNLNISDTDIVRSRAGASLLGSPAGLVTGTESGNSTTISAGGGPGGTSAGASGAGAGASGLVLTANGQGPVPTISDPLLTGTAQLQRATTPEPNQFITGAPTLIQNTDSYNFQYQQGFRTGATLTVGFQNTRLTTNSFRSGYSPELDSTFNAQITQHLLNGFGIGVNTRFMAQAINNRRITDSAFRQQLLFTINQVENIYWNLVSAYESVQSAQRALDQSTQVASDNRKQLQIGTLAPLDVLNADNQVAQDKQTLITAQTTLEFQQLIIKQAIARNLDDPGLSQAPVIPTDRVSLIEMPEETAAVEDLVKEADQDRPEIEQAVLNLKNDQITLKGVKNGLLPVVDLYGFYGSTTLGGAPNPNCSIAANGPEGCAITPGNYSDVFRGLFNGDTPNRGVGVNISIPLRNRPAQALHERSLLEFRQDQLKLQQLYTQIRIGVINAQYALTNDRAAVQAATATREYNAQALDAEKKKFKYGASTTALVLQQERSLAAAENTVTSAMATYAKDRASLEQTLANTLQKYNISIGDGVSGTVTQQVTIPGLEPAPKNSDANLPSQQQQLHTPPVAPPSPLPQTPPQPQAPQQQ